MKKRGFGVGNWNGTGGKIETGESIEDGAKREAKEEFGVELKILENMGETMFIFKDGLEIHCHIFVCKDWNGEPTEGEEMAPKWFNIEDIPFESMWVDDPFWLPLVIKDKQIKGKFVFGDNNELLEKEIVVL